MFLFGFLRSLCNEDQLWENICHSTWPSLTDPRVSDVISTFPSGHRSFYHDSFPVLHPTSDPIREIKITYVPSELISAVDIRYQEKMVYSKVELTNTVAGKVLSTPLWIEVVEPKPMDQPGFSLVNFEEQEKEFLEDLEKSVTLNWILIDPIIKRAGNFSSVRPARRHWMTNEITPRFVTILAGAEDSSSKMVQCRIEVTCGGNSGQNKSGEKSEGQLLQKTKGRDVGERGFSGKSRPFD